MKIYNLILLAALLGSASVAQKAPEAPFKVEVSAEQSTAKVGSEVPITILLTNNSSKDLDVSANISNLTGADPNYIYDVRDSKGKPVPKRVFPHPELATSRAIFRTLNPGQTLTDQQDLNRIFLLDRPGKYTVRVSHRNPEPNHSVPQLSKPIVLTLTP
jgi:hypothetical protein